MAVVVILGYSIIRGIFRGMIREVAAIAGVLGGFYMAYRCHEGFGGVFSAIVENPQYQNILAFLAIFCAVFVGVTLAGVLLRTLLKLVLLGVVDRVFGALFGAVKGVIIVSVLFFLLTTFLPRGGVEMVGQSKLAPAVNSTATTVVHVVPDSTKKALADKMQTLKRQWENRREDSPSALPKQ
ncbi:MAG: CvpA family protein [Thermodesulfobacteriota bacterium]